MKTASWAVTAVALTSMSLVVATASAQPSGLTSDCTGAWGRYSSAPGPKAFAAGRKQGCGWQIKSDSFPTMAAIRAQALRQCAQHAGEQGGCRIIDQSR